MRILLALDVFQVQQFSSVQFICGSFEFLRLCQRHGKYKCDNCLGLEHHSHNIVNFTSNIAMNKMMHCARNDICAQPNSLHVVVADAMHTLYQNDDFIQMSCKWTETELNLFETALLKTSACLCEFLCKFLSDFCEFILHSDLNEDVFNVLHLYHHEHIPYDSRLLQSMI